MDKAGSYGMQGLAGIFIKKINGCYFNVVGFPVYKVYKNLQKMGVNLFEYDRWKGKTAAHKHELGEFSSKQ